MRTADDQLSSYRSLRERDLNDETQAMKTTEDQHGFKVVLDVHDFPSEDVKVKVVDNKEVVVEGRVEKNDGTFRSSKSFCRRFNFPGEVDMNAVTSAMSSDGVLTITAPKVAEGYRYRNKNGSSRKSGEGEGERKGRSPNWDRPTALDTRCVLYELCAWFDTVNYGQFTM
ncbi:heat shock protein beta-1-like [Penaeus japonicus]|uniref:heat shock protein beta-1-like n=1 Tax=Penaeus japonicus TaxID=27405 RepID=UPI001C711880|nr:heat shock protein beta-1-like [Penaeus japonicus]